MLGTDRYLGDSSHMGSDIYMYMDKLPTYGTFAEQYIDAKSTCYDFRRAYLQSLQSTLAKLPVTNPDEVEPENAQAVINRQCSILGKAMHQAAYAGLS